VVPEPVVLVVVAVLVAVVVVGPDVLPVVEVLVTVVAEPVVPPVVAALAPPEPNTGSPGWVSSWYRPPHDQPTALAVTTSAKRIARFDIFARHQLTIRGSAHKTTRARPVARAAVRSV
jgi:hypothetical protein